MQIQWYSRSWDLDTNWDSGCKNEVNQLLSSGINDHRVILYHSIIKIPFTPPIISERHESCYRCLEFMLGTALPFLNVVFNFVAYANYCELTLFPQRGFFTMESCCSIEAPFNNYTWLLVTVCNCCTVAIYFHSYSHSHTCLIFLKLLSTRHLSFLYNSHSLQRSNSSLEARKTARQLFRAGLTSEKSSTLSEPHTFYNRRSTTISLLPISISDTSTYSL